MSRDLSAPLLAVGAALLGAGALWTVGRVATGQPVLPALPGGDPVEGFDRARLAAIIRKTVATESGGRYGAMNRNADNQGLSFGIIQWSQGGGGLGPFLTGAYNLAPQRFLAIFGPASADLLEITNRPTRTLRLAPVEGRVLWETPWTTRFAKMAEDPVFRAYQEQAAVDGYHMRTAVEAAKLLGVRTERGLALMYDAAVASGGLAKTWARRANTRCPGCDEAAKLATFAHVREQQFVSDTKHSDRWKWNEARQKYEKWSGRFNLATGTANRSARVLSSSQLTDAPVVSVA